MSRNFDALKTPLQGFLAYHSRFVPPARWITFSGVPSTLTNFPVLVKANGWQNIANGYDVHFQDSAGNELAFELDWYDDSVKSGAWWVQVPTLYSGTVIKVLYGDASIVSDQSSPATVWSNYNYVYHFTDPNNMKSSVGTYVAEAYNKGVDFESVTLVSSSMTGRGISFRVSAGYGSSHTGIRFADKISGVPRTLSAYMSSVTVGNDAHSVSAQTGWQNFGFRCSYSTCKTYAGSQEHSINWAAGTSLAYGSSTSSSGVAWVQDCAILDSSACTANSFRWDDPILTATGDSKIPTVFVFDELRIGSVYRSADWLLYEQLNLAQHDNYTSYSQEV